MAYVPASYTLYILGYLFYLFVSNCVCIGHPDALLLPRIVYLFFIFLFHFSTNICAHFFSLETSGIDVKL